MDDSIGVRSLRKFDKRFDDQFKNLEKSQFLDVRRAPELYRKFGEKFLQNKIGFKFWNIRFEFVKIVQNFDIFAAFSGIGFEGKADLYKVMQELSFLAWSKNAATSLVRTLPRRHSSVISARSRL